MNCQLISNPFSSYPNATACTIFNASYINNIILFVYKKYSCYFFHPWPKSTLFLPSVISKADPQSYRSQTTC